MKFPFVVVLPFLPVNGMAIFPFILIRQRSHKKDAVLMRHESIHLRQELELLIIPFYILYILNYGLNLWRYKNHDAAYLNIVFEREAYVCETDVNYLKGRKFWAWVKFARIKS